MNANYSASNPIFRDQPLTKFNPACSGFSSLHEACREQSDPMDAVLRIALVLCMLMALVFSGWHLNAGQKANVPAAQPAMVASAGFSVSGQHVF